VNHLSQLSQRGGKMQTKAPDVVDVADGSPVDTTSAEAESEFLLEPVVEIAETVQPVENMTRFCSGCR
jgi:hypothetical protein